MSNLEMSQSASTGAERQVNVEQVDVDDNQNIISQPIDQHVVESTSTDAPAKKGRKRKSTVWEYFIEIKTTCKGVEVPFLQCVCCGCKFHKSKTGTTSQLLRHVRECDKIKSKSEQFSEMVDKKQKTLGFLPVEVDSFVNLPILHDSKVFDQSLIREIIAKMIIVHEYPFMMVEHTWFNILLKVLNPRYESVSRNTIKNDCMKVYECEKDKLKSSLKHVNRVSLTSDCWTSNQTIGYMCLTVHYIDESWKLQKRIISFIELEPPHSGTYICDAISDVLLEWNLHDKVSTITLDNASNNDVAASTLKANFHARGKLHFNGLFFHVRCCAHILNIMVQDGLKEIQEVIINIRESVKYLKKSPARLHKFVEVSKQLGVPTTRSLSSDVPTRWNSTFNMLESAFIYRSVFVHYADRDINYKWLPQDSDWLKYEKIRKFLSVFNNVTKMISGSTYPTSNIFLPAVMHVKKLLIEESVSSDEYMRHMTLAMKLKFDKYWGECNMLMSIAAIMDPRLKLKFITFSFPKIYTHVEAFDKIKLVEEILWEIYATYVNDLTSPNSDTVDGCSTSGEPKEFLMHFDCMLGFKDYVASSGSMQPTKSDLQVYLEEGLVVSSSELFDVLDWWKMNTLKFPSLSKMARDILSIPITTVASESAFSAGGRVLDDYRSCLSTKTVNALVCAASWIRASQKNTKTPLEEILEQEKLNVQLNDY